MTSVVSLTDLHSALYYRVGVLAWNKLGTNMPYSYIGARLRRILRVSLTP